jgi:2-keto-3-deoxy-L-rhamnonate aldolase RhmA
VRENPLRRRLAAGGSAVGLMVSEFGTVGITRIAEAAGAAFVLFDQEHTSWTGERLRGLLAAARANEVPALVRVPARDRHLVASALDAGAAGVMVPMVESEREAREIVAAAKYPPIGRRGFGALYADDYVDGDVPATIELTNREQLVIAQVETAAGLEGVERIAAVDGVDIVWLGQFDLTISMRIPGSFDDPGYLGAVRRLVDAAAAVGKPAGIAAPSAEQASAASRSTTSRCSSGR